LSIAGTSYLNKKGYKIASALYKHAIWGNGKPLSKSITNRIVTKLKKSKDINNKITSILKKIKGKTVEKKLGIEFKTGDLYYALQHVTLYIKGKRKNNKWNLKITVKDTYDFDEIRTFEKISFGNAANDLGYAMQKIGMMKKYSIKVSYNIVR
jgi:hypothetical protein